MIVNRTVNGSTKRYIERFYPTAQAFDFDTATDFVTSIAPKRSRRPAARQFPAFAPRRADR